MAEVQGCGISSHERGFVLLGNIPWDLMPPLTPPPPGGAGLVAGR